jgi:hypothetical protein
LVGEINERVVSLSQEIAELRKGVEEAKALPETQGQRKLLRILNRSGLAQKQL